MSLKAFLQEKGFIEKDKAEGKQENVSTTASAQVAPTYFPIDNPSSPVTVPTQSDSGNDAIDPAFIKFFEDYFDRIIFVFGYF
ncbi:MAG: hypothetical protein ACJ75B_22325, partial [Flavisolibacter sp.]